jgi:hypothetical protein
MDATQKKKMWKVAIIHFASSLILFLYPIYLVKFGHIMSYSGDPDSALIQQALAGLIFKCALALQPQFLLFVFGGEYGLYSQHFAFALGLLSCLLIPIWSICFGWLFVKFDNWLNHFPILGRKVFSNRKS